MSGCRSRNGTAVSAASSVRSGDDADVRRKRFPDSIPRQRHRLVRLHRDIDAFDTIVVEPRLGSVLLGQCRQQVLDERGVVRVRPAEAARSGQRDAAVLQVGGAEDPIEWTEQPRQRHGVGCPLGLGMKGVQGLHRRQVLRRGAHDGSVAQDDDPAPTRPRDLTLALDDPDARAAEGVAVAGESPPQLSDSVVWNLSEHRSILPLMLVRDHPRIVAGYRTEVPLAGGLAALVPVTMSAPIVQFGSPRTPDTRHLVRRSTDLGAIWQPCSVSQRMIAVALGVGAGLVQFLVPERLGFVFVILAAFAAGWLLAEEPMAAAMLFMLPAVVLGALRVLVDGESGSFGALAFGLVLAVMFAAFFTHIGAGVALRRRNAERKG